MSKRTVNRKPFVHYPKMVKSPEEKTEFLKSEIKDTLLKLESPSKSKNDFSIDLPFDLDFGRLLEALMKKTGKKGKHWVDYVNSEFDGISCWAEIKYVFSVKYPQDNIEPDVKTEGLEMFYEIISPKLNPDYRYYVEHNGTRTELKRYHERVKRSE